MTQEAKRQHGVGPDAAHAGAQRLGERLEVGGAVIGQVTALDVAPQGLDRIQLRGVGRQALDGEPGPLGGDVRAHAATGVRAQAIPQQDDPLPSEVALECPQEGQQGICGIGARPSLEEQPSAPSIPPKGQGGGDGQPLPVVERVGQDRRLPARRPGTADDWVLREAAFVLEDQPGAPPTGVFFTAGQRSRTHRRMAASSRSAARRAGRCSDQFKLRRRYQTCPGW